MYIEIPGKIDCHVSHNHLDVEDQKHATKKSVHIDSPVYKPTSTQYPQHGHLQCRVVLVL